jgi:hypothetical protein
MMENMTDEAKRYLLGIAFMGWHWFFMYVAIQIYRSFVSPAQSDIYIGFQLVQLDWWMKLFVFVHPLAIGASIVSSVGKCLTPGQILASLVMGIINGPLEEYFWRVQIMEIAGRDGLLSKYGRLVSSTVMFAAWHIAWCYFNFPPAKFQRATVGSIGATLIFGYLWGLIVQKNQQNYFAVGFHHGLFNILAIFPAQFNAAFGNCEAVPDFFG